MKLTGIALFIALVVLGTFIGAKFPTVPNSIMGKVGL